MKNIAIICGGDSSEAEVSLKSGANLKNMMDNEKYNSYIVFMKRSYWVVRIEGQEDILLNKADFTFTLDNTVISFDCAYITIHGTPGENGILQSYFELIQLPYTSCNVFVSSLTFNKFACKSFLKEFDIPSADAMMVRKGDKINAEAILLRLGSPCFVKPNNAGSSFGVSKVKSAKEIVPAIEKAFVEDDEVIIEQYLSGTEVTNGVFRVNGTITVLPITEIVSENEFFDYEAKYTGKSKEITPARLSKEIETETKALTERIYTILGCTGIVRIDYIINANGINLLEVNTTPGMSPASIIPQQIIAHGMQQKDVFSSVIEDAILRMKK